MLQWLFFVHLQTTESYFVRLCRMVLTNNAPDEAHPGLFLGHHVRVLGATFGPSTDCHHELDIRVRLAKSREVSEATLFNIQLRNMHITVVSIY